MLMFDVDVTASSFINRKIGTPWCVGRPTLLVDRHIVAMERGRPSAFAAAAVATSDARRGGGGTVAGGIAGVRHNERARKRKVGALLAGPSRQDMSDRTRLAPHVARRRRDLWAGRPLHERRRPVGSRRCFLPPPSAS